RHDDVGRAQAHELIVAARPAVERNVGFAPVLVTREANRAFVDVDSDVRLVRLQVVEGSARAASNVEHGATGVQFEQFVRAGNVDPSDDDGPNSVVNERVPDDTTIK